MPSTELQIYESLSNLEWAAIRSINRYSRASTGVGSLRPETRRVIAALRALGIRRREFRARWEPHLEAAVGRPKSAEAAARIEANAGFLCRCGLSVFVPAEAEHESAYVKTSSEPQIVVTAAVAAPVLELTVAA